jgi:uncharacterized protein involved in outer membrane biogenesis
MKTFLKVGGIILLLMALGLVVLSVSLNSTIKVGVESLGPAITGTDVTLEDVDLSLLTGEGQLEKLVIGNPPGFQSNHAFYLGTVHVKADLPSIWSDTIRIQEIFVDSPEISFESTPLGSNISIIHDHIGSFARSGGESGSDSKRESPNGKSEQPGGSQEKPLKEQKIRIDRFIVKNGRITVSTPLLKDQMITIGLPVVQIRDIGKQSGGVTLKEISSLIYSETQKAIEKELSKSGIPLGTDLKDLDKKLGGILKDASEFLEGIKGLFGK